MITIPIYTFVTIILITFALIGVMVHFTHKYQVMETKAYSQGIDLNEAINHFNYWKSRYKKLVNESNSSEIYELLNEIEEKYMQSGLIDKKLVVKLMTLNKGDK